MSFLRWGNGGALTDPTSVPAREPSPARNSGKDKFLCPFSSLKKNPHPHPARKRMPSFVTGPNRQPPSSSQTAGERSQPAHIDACSLAYHIPSKRKEEQQSCPRNHPPHCPKSHTPRPRPSSSGGYSPPAPPYVFGPDSPKASKQATKISIPARVSLQSVLPVFCSLSFSPFSKPYCTWIPDSPLPQRLLYPSMLEIRVSARSVFFNEEICRRIFLFPSFSPGQVPSRGSM